MNKAKTTAASPSKVKDDPISSKRKGRKAKPNQPASENATPATNDPQKGARATRETIESIVIAIVLAFLFRGFEAEAFVIPTGSMADTLQGRHVDVECAQCGYRYRGGASCENDDTDTPGVVAASTCPVCRYTMLLNRESASNKDSDPNQESFTGDRILVSKFAYDFADPRRWDVVVFKYPGDPEQNYIKRLVGLPGETVTIRHGDIYITKPGQSQSQIARKPAAKVAATLLIVDDNQYIPDALVAANWDSRWQPMIRSGVHQWRSLTPSQQSLWRLPQQSEDKTSISNESSQGVWGQTLHLKADSVRRVWRQEFSTKGIPGVEAWLRYRHVFPSMDEWSQIAQGEPLRDHGDRLAPEPDHHRGQLITDFTAYNVSIPIDPQDFRRHHQLDDANWQKYILEEAQAKEQHILPHWVGDLAVECKIAVGASAASDQADNPAPLEQSPQIMLDLVKAGVHYECRINLSDGKAVLSIDGAAKGFQNTNSTSSNDPSSANAAGPQGDTNVRLGGEYLLRFANVNNELFLWVNGRSIKFDKPTTYSPPPSDRPVWSPSDPGDLSPVGIGSRGASVTVGQLRVFRDVYYTAISGDDPGQGDDYIISFSEAFDKPEKWAVTELFDMRREVSFKLRDFPGRHEDDQFFVMGDNSPQSSDARTWVSSTKNKWEPPQFVERRLLTGKALFVYWPHHWRRPIPYLPNFKRMGFIR